MKEIIWKKIKMSNGATYRIQATFGDLSLSILILESNDQEMSAYKTPLILEQRLKKHASQVHLNYDEYFERLIKLFKNPESIDLKITRNSFTILETLNSDLKVKFFTTDLERVSDFESLIGSVLDELNEENANTKRDYDEIVANNKSLEAEVQELKNKLQELVERKNVDDEVMMGNFVSLLNEKKRRIQHLNELLEAYRINPALCNPAEVNITYKRKRKIEVKEDLQQRKNVKEEVSESDDSNYKDEESSRGSEINEIVDPGTLEQNSFEDKFYDDILDKSPPSVKLPAISKDNFSSMSKSPVPSTSRGECAKSLRKGVCEENENVPEKSKILSNPVIDINTQDWLDNL